MDYIVYFDESGDDGVTGSPIFVLTSIYMSFEAWQANFDLAKSLRRQLKVDYGFHVSEEMHTNKFLTNKNPYRNYNWTNEQKREILIAYAKMIAQLDMKCVNVVIDKTKFKDSNYRVLENALKYNIQRIEKDSHEKWKYILISDKGRIAPMRETARKIRKFNPIPSKYSNTQNNQPIANIVEDILEKDSKDSYFIQICDFISYFVSLYYRLQYQKDTLPNRAADLIDNVFVSRTMKTISCNFNEMASSNPYGLVIYPK